MHRSIGQRDQDLATEPIQRHSSPTNQPCCDILHHVIWLYDAKPVNIIYHVATHHSDERKVNTTWTLHDVTCNKVVMWRAVMWLDMAWHDVMWGDAIWHDLTSSKSTQHQHVRSDIANYTTPQSTIQRNMSHHLRWCGAVLQVMLS